MTGSIYTEQESKNKSTALVILLHDLRYFFLDLGGESSGLVHAILGRRESSKLESLRYDEFAW